MTNFEITANVMKRNESSHLEVSFHIDESRGLAVLTKAFFAGSKAEIMANLARDRVVEYLAKESMEDDATLPFVLKTYLSLKSNLMFNALIIANRALLEANRELPFHERGSVSVAIAMVSDKTVCVAAVGDCGLLNTVPGVKNNDRTFLIRPETLSEFSQIKVGSTSDLEHSLVTGNIPLGGLGLWADFEPQLREFHSAKGSIYTLYAGDFVDERNAIQSSSVSIMADIKF